MTCKLALLFFIFKVASVKSEFTGRLGVGNDVNLLPRSTDVKSFETDASPTSYSKVRRKRIIFGQSFTLYDQPIVDHQAAIFPGQFCDNNNLQRGNADPGVAHFEQGWDLHRIHQFFMEKVCLIKTTRPHCSGTAITKSIIQTACHCISRPIYRQVPDKHYRGFVRLKVFNDFEDHTLVKVGVLRYDNSTRTNTALWFIVHPKCADSYGYITHDFGLIHLTYPFDENFKTPPIPTYTELLFQKQYIESREMVCMIVGWGYTDYLEKDGEIFYGIFSPNVQYAWHVLVSKYDCYLAQSNEYNFDLAFPNTTFYKNKATWMCHKPFGRRRSLITPGDAGGPMICLDNLYYALQQWHRSNTPYSILDTLSTSPIELNGAGPLADFPGVNAAEYREQYFDTLRGIIQPYKQTLPSSRLRYNEIIPGIDGTRTSDANKSFRLQWLLILPTIFLNY